ncbi:MAG: adenosylmethionine decarboxylase [Chloroflexi bacterium]|nr:adenosylmethionine decarboxylase [Chloroflexota bacterium]MCL5076404.1 adenosylmethionine decarboxylase [Chloroflexota bacterium]
MKVLGRHLLIELHGCEPGILNDVKSIEDIMVEAVSLIKATIIDVFSHRFQPYGVSVMVMIAESHLSIHTWPEFSYAAVDVFTCADDEIPEEVTAYFASVLKATDFNALEVKRGVLDPDKRRVYRVLESV